MQTFTPYSDFEATARVLDTKRLGKQRVEVIQIVRALTVPGYAWSSHPAVLMWKGFEEALGRYGLTMCDVWIERGFGDTCAATIVADLETFGISSIRSYPELAADRALPAWLFDPEVLRSHQSALVRKDPEHYRGRFPDVPDDIDYVWPVRSSVVIERELRKEENARRRQQRVSERLAIEAAKARRRRSLAAKRGWQRRKAQTASPQIAGEAGGSETG
jgi:Pyrimidine dimer DNA glycosylase